MYRVAIILNESELLRSGFANTVPRLKALPQLANYDFQSFTVVNIALLFHPGPGALQNYDSLVISTNATSDRTVLAALRDNAKTIQAFLEAGKGVFVSYQKKLNATAADASKGQGATGFLPSEYEFISIERPQLERDSGQGSISVAPDANGHVLLVHPETVSAEVVEERCRLNEFRRHFYRSHLAPKSAGAYLPLLGDFSYPDPASRVLLMVNRSPKSRERVVVSTVAVDWEFHQALLTNIISFVTEGAPSVAFIRKADSPDGDYDFLVTSAQLSKLPYSVYKSWHEIPRKLLSIHNSYIFAPGWDEGTLLEFIRFSGQTARESGVARHRKTYFFRRVGGILLMAQHSSFSTVDVMIEQAAFWLAARYEGTLWGGGFWITHDVLGMMFASQIDCGIFVPPVLRDIEKHYSDGSYDQVMGSTCGLARLLSKVLEQYPARAEEGGFGLARLRLTYRWIVDNYSSQSLNDKLNAFLTLQEAGKYSRQSDVPVDDEIRADMAAEIAGRFDLSRFKADECTEIEVCNWMAFFLSQKPVSSENVMALLDNLRERQSPGGEWTNTGRTAHVLVFLLEYWSDLEPILDVSGERNAAESIVYDGILSLRGQYNWRAGNWNGDLQATAKAAHAIRLFNAKYKLSTQDFLRAIDTEGQAMQASALLQDMNHALDKLRRDNSEEAGQVRALENLLRQRTMFRKAEFVWRVLALTSVPILMTVLGLLTVDHWVILKEVVGAAALPAAVIAVVLTLVAEVIKRKMIDQLPETPKAKGE